MIAAALSVAWLVAAVLLARRLVRGTPTEQHSYLWVCRLCGENSARLPSERAVRADWRLHRDLRHTQAPSGLDPLP